MVPKYLKPAPITSAGAIGSSEDMLEIDFANGKISQVGDQYGIGRAAHCVSVSRPAAPVDGLRSILDFADLDRGDDTDGVSGGSICAWFESVEEMQTVLDSYMESYNQRRPIRAGSKTDELRHRPSYS
jgi:hypothetical protein